MSGKNKKKKQKKGNDDAVATEADVAKGAYERFVTAAQELDHRDLLPMRGDVQLAYRNSRKALDAVLAREATIAAELPAAGIDDLRQMPDLALAVAHASDEVTRASKSSEELDALLHRARRLRKRLLKTAGALAEAGAVQESDLEKLRDGDGASETAEGLLNLAALVGAHEGALKKKKHAVSSKKLAESLEVGAEIKSRIQPGGASGNGAGSPDVAHAEEIRDRLWTLLNERYQRLWRVGAYLFGQSVEERLPALQSRASVKKALVKARRSVATQDCA